MANPQGARGSLAETLVTQFFNDFYPPEQEEEGLLWSRIRGKGSRDEGDVFGPFTSIEVKNYTSRVPISSSLLANAERKAEFSKRRFWFLVSKPPGLGAKRVNKWPVITNVESAIEMFELPLSVDDVEALVLSGGETEGDVTCFKAEGTVPFSLTGLNTYTKTFPKFRSIVGEKGEELSLVALPRKGEKRVTMEPAKWFVVSTLGDLAWYFQKGGILPLESQDK